ncbi:MAG: histidine phosphatase family protein [Planctomycetes bacterium]|nr:histidine phosphatase family protein [Planctomycetota bacterium]
MSADARPVVLLTRHGETAWNRERRMQGQVDVPLSPEGEAQAEVLATRLRGAGLARIVSSDLERAAATARAVARATGLAVTLDARLREQSLGAWEGRTFAEVVGSDPDTAARFRARDPDARPAGGETRGELFARVAAALDDVAAPGTAGPVLVVAHGGVVQALVYRALALPIRAERRFLVPNVSLTTLLPRADGWVLRTLSDVAHLASSPGDNFPFE